MSSKENVLYFSVVRDIKNGKYSLTSTEYQVPNPSSIEFDTLLRRYWRKNRYERENLGASPKLECWNDGTLE